ncbi:unnamed protein product, partial [Ectocarpus sp. 12 AP-2014]
RSLCWPLKCCHSLPGTAEHRASRGKRVNAGPSRVLGCGGQETHDNPVRSGGEAVWASRSFRNRMAPSTRPSPFGSMPYCSYWRQHPLHLRTRLVDQAEQLVLFERLLAEHFEDGLVRR